MAGPLTHATTTGLEPVTVPQWDRVWHGFLGREGGVSRGEFGTLNFSYHTGDQRAAVDANWARLRQCFAPETEVALLRQVHGNQVHKVARGGQGHRLEGDGMVSVTPNLLLGILTADCVPVLLFDEAAGAVGALHAGWRGVLAGIAGQGIRQMEELGAKPARMRAAIGPAIGFCCFEVDAELARRFIAEDPEAAAYARAGSPGKAYLDLRGLIACQLKRAGVAPAAIAQVADCTRCQSDRYFSRRASGGRVTGLQLSFVGLKPS